MVSMVLISGWFQCRGFSTSFKEMVQEDIEAMEFSRLSGCKPETGAGRDFLVIIRGGGSRSDGPVTCSFVDIKG